MRTFATAAFSLGVVITLTAAADMPLKISEVTTARQGSQGHVRLTNTSSQPVTAWAVGVTLSAEGGRTRREVYTVDGYLSEITHGLPGSTERTERLMPGQSRQITLDPLPAGATVDVIAAVLDDGTTAGDQDVIAEIFANRAKERDALKAVVDVFKEVLAAKQGAEAVAVLKERLTALVQRDNSVPCRAALDAVQAHERTAAAAVNIDQSLREYADFVTRQYELAAKHSARK